MAFVNSSGYLVKRTGRLVVRNWWMIKAVENGSGSFSGYVHLDRITFPQGMLGKKVRFKIEVMEE